MSPSPLHSDERAAPPATPRFALPRRTRVAARAAAARAMLSTIVPYDTELRLTATTPRSVRRIRIYARLALRRIVLTVRHIPILIATPALVRRLALHTLMVLMVLAVTLGEVFAQVSLQTQLPWSERPTTLVGGSAPALANAVDSLGGELVSRQLPVETPSVRVQLAQTTEPDAPPSRAPRIINEAYRDYYTMAADETLGQVAARYQVSVASLLQVNGLAQGDVLAIGQELRIPRVSGLMYVVREGDTLETIAAQVQVDPAAIVRFAPNRVSFDAALPVGREIFIPAEMVSLPAELLERFGGESGLAARTPRPAALILEDETNVREGPGRIYAKVAQLNSNAMVELIGRYESWLKVQLPDAVGWIKSDLIAPYTINLDDLPVTEDFPPPPPIWVWPTRGTITSGFGSRWGGFHNGLDIANRAWTPILAARAGRVAEAGWCSGYGYCVRINHGGGVETIYGHLITQPSVRTGEEVAVGQFIGSMGSTYDRAGGGYSTGVHLHFTVLVNGRAVNPLRFLP